MKGELRTAANDPIDKHFTIPFIQFFDGKQWRQFNWSLPIVNNRRGLKPATTWIEETTDSPPGTAWRSHQENAAKSCSTFVPQPRVQEILFVVTCSIRRPRDSGLSC